MKKRATPDPAALAIARSMRRFDADLTDDEIAEIARVLGENATLRASLNPKKHSLDNAVGPLGTVRVEP